MMHLLRLVAMCATTLAFGTNAAVIDNEDSLAGSFIDTNTNLVWMDFGINNNYTYYEVVSKLADGGEFEGWRLPDYDEVYDMWFGVINASNSDIDRVREDFYGPGTDLYLDANSDGADDSVWDNAFDVMGYNSLGTGFTGFDYTKAWGLFAGEDAMYSIVFDDFLDLEVDGETREDSIAFNNGWNQEYLADDINTNLSTLLVRVTETVNVSEPNTIALFTVVLCAFVTVRRREESATH
ncbi:hypothetical protein [Alteromonas sp. KUL49]|uniref:hypothetical protein n=1 Tax=Alteromonas sp. KUL49 TaxID=2480798 RepID=UPI00102F17DA|nr:hypothetical protein [Alteromonas sp. KUL49]TAP40841.1 hypothetical protein EYS00_06940 [Alteromonas sp. KUL49]